MKRALLAVAIGALCFAAVACGSGEPAPDSSEGTVNQFGQQREALTLSDGGQCNIVINPASELLIRDVPVVEDPVRTVWTGATTTTADGAWTFGRLMTSMAGPNDPSAFVLAWLRQWETAQAVNGFTVAPRPAMNTLVTAPWLAASGGTRLDLTKAPFRLLAIVNRMDLRNLAAGSAGEGRFVFGVLDQAGNQTQFTVILEYRLPATTNADITTWANKWHALSAQTFGSPAYNTALEAVTNGFAAKNVAPTRPNGSSINQVRTNEIALSAPWEMREFHVDPTRGALVEATVSQTPDLSLNNSPTLASWVNANTPALLAGTDVVPATFNGAPFLGGSALTNPGAFWSAPGITNNDARFTLSVNTCNGCHQGETGTTFLHIAPRNPGAASVLSTFLTGKTLPDPVSGVTRTFNDLDFRTRSLADILCVAPPAGPTVTVTAPTAGAKLTATTTLKASVSGGVTAVQYFVDGNPVAPAVASPFTFAWDPTTVPFGAHTIKAVGTASASTVTSASVAFTTAPINAPDFVVTGVTAPFSVTPGASFTALVTACNRGNQPGSAPVDLVLSTDKVFDPTAGDRLLGGTFLSLTPGQCTTVPVNASASPPGPGSTFFLGAVADLPRGVPELDESNNASPALAFNIGFAPDFVITAAKAPPSADIGATFTTQVTVCNRGTAPGPAPITVILSTDNTISPSEPRIGFGQTPPLSPSQCATVAVAGQALPPGPPPATFFLGAIVNPDNTIGELNPANDISPISTIGIGAAPDFTITALTAPPSALPGAPITATATVCNNGTVAGSTSVQLALSKDTVIAPVLTPPGPNDDVFVGPSVNVPLNPGLCASVPLQGSATPPGGPGVYFVGAVVDANKVVPELNETNNAFASKTATGIGFGPDFIVKSITAPSSAAPGSSFVATVVLCNQGTAPGATSASMFLSLDATISVAPPVSDTSDRQVGAGPFVSLDPGQCATQSVTTFAQPPNGPGPFFLGAVADAQGSVVELIETNNANRVSLPIGNAPDFVVTALTGVTAVGGGVPLLNGPFQASVTVCNRGTMGGITDVDLVISADSTISTPVRNPPPGQDAIVTNAPASLSLAPGQCLTQVITGFGVSPTGAPGSFFLAAVADVASRVPELVETNNNSAVSAFTLR